MSRATAPLPEDYAALRAFAASLQSTIETRDAELQVYKDELYAKTLHIEKLKLQLAALRRARFGRSSEKLDREIVQLEMQLGDLEEGQAEHTERQKRAQPQSPPAAPRKRIQPVRKPLPKHLPRERVEHDAACICRRCGGERLRRIGTDEREVLEYVPSHFKVIVHARPKMSCRDCEKITQEPMPPLPIERGIPGPGLLAHICATSSGGSGIILSTGSMSCYLGWCVNKISPTYNRSFFERACQNARLSSSPRSAKPLCTILSNPQHKIFICLKRFQYYTNRLTFIQIRTTVVDMVENHKETELDSIFHALADSTRRDMLARLAREDIPMSGLAKSYAITLAAVCKHLRVLEEAALITITKEGRVRHCNMNPAALDNAAAQIEFYRQFWSHQLDGLEQQVHQSKRNPPKNERKKS